MNITAPRFSARRLLTASAVALVVAGGATACSSDSDDADETAAAPVTVTVTPETAPSTSAATEAADTTRLGATSAAPLITALELARDAAPGTPTDISIERDGSWSVTLEKGSGDETEVNVADGKATITEQDLADDAADIPSAGSLGGADLRRAVAAALDASPDARVTGVDLESGMSAYAVDLVAADGSEIETHLTDGFAIASSETESPDTDD